MKRFSLYAPPTPSAHIICDLSRNEGRAPSWLDASRVDAATLARYPDMTELRGELAGRFGLEPARVLVTAGGDDALLRACLATLEAGREALLSRPTFEMIPRYVTLAGGGLSEVEWPDGPFPVGRFLAAASDRTSIAFVVSPNNPTGAVATPDDVDRIARALPRSLVVLDAAYGEFAVDDPTPKALLHDNVVVVRTLSKAWGLAGLRVGFALGSPAWVRRLAACGNPFPVSVASAAIALQRLRTGAEDVKLYVEHAARQREELTQTFRSLGVRVALPSEGNFVLARDVDAAWTSAALGALGFAVRIFPDLPDLSDAVRVTVPGVPSMFERLQAAVVAAIAPKALLFDLDGVLADVSRSYRSVILATARHYGVTLSGANVEAAKRRGDANDDWSLTARLLAEGGVTVSLQEVTARFESLYQGAGSEPGLHAHEVPLVAREVLAAWRKRFPLAIVTGRPRADAIRFLERFELRTLFDAIVCREDGPLKPDPAPVRRALERLGVRSAWMLGDTRDDVSAARAAGVVPIGVLSPGVDADLARRDLMDAGAARVLDRTLDLWELLP